MTKNKKKIISSILVGTSVIASSVTAVTLVSNQIKNKDSFINESNLQNYRQNYNRFESISYNSNTNLENRSWMKYLNDNKKITEINIPGTHDSAMFDGYGIAYFFAKSWSKTQSKNFDEQLKQGIRFFDLRINYNLDLIHGPTYSTSNLKDTLSKFANFLELYPSEFLVLRIRSEDYNGNSRGWYEKEYERRVFDLLKQYENRLFKNKLGGWPKVKELRSKMLILNNLNRNISNNTDYGPRYGVSYPDQYVHIQDEFKLKGYPKLSEVKDHIKIATADKDTSTLFLNYTSHNHWTGTIWNLNSWLMPKVQEWFDIIRRENAGYIKAGIMIMDYPGDGMVQKIIDSNF